MSKKMNGELKFQLEILKMLYSGELVETVIVRGTEKAVPGCGFSALMIGDGKIYRKLRRNMLIAPDLDNPYDIYQHREDFVLGEGYVEAEKVDSLNVGTEKKKKICIRLKTKKDFVWVRDKYLEYFNDNVRFFIRDEFSPIIVMSREVPSVEGMIFPFIAKR